jgi:hypothetical protein
MTWHQAFAWKAPQGERSFVLYIERVDPFYKGPLNQWFTKGPAFFRGVSIPETPPRRQNRNAAAPFIAPSTEGWDERAMLAPLLLAALLAGSAPTTASGAPVLWLENARVTQVSPPAPDSGHFAVYRDFEVVLPGGRTYRLYVLWMSQHQYMPDVGATCSIAYRRGALLPGNLHRPPGGGQRDVAPFNVVQELGCGFAPNPMPPPVQRRPSA